MNLFFRIIGEVVERILPHRWTEHGAKKPRQRRSSPKVHPRPLQTLRPSQGTPEQHARRLPPTIDLRREGIWVDEECIGEFVSDYAIVTPDFVFKWARHSRNLTRYLRSLPLPPEFTWFYVDVITVHPEWRGQGIAKAVFDKVGRERKPVLIMLIPEQPRAIGWGASVQKKNAEDQMSQARRLAIYKNLGFDVVRIKNRHFGKGTIGFRFVPDESESGIGQGKGEPREDATQRPNPAK